MLAIFEACGGCRAPGKVEGGIKLSASVQRELLDHRVGEQVSRQLGQGLKRRLIGGPAYLDLESLALPYAEHLAISETMSRIRDGVSLRVVNFRLEHDVYNDSGHVSSHG
jgi:hypothetical protein